MSKHNRDRRKPRQPQPRPKPPVLFLGNPTAPCLQAVIAAAQRALASGQIRPGTLSHIDVLHDDGCPILAGTGPCNCNPEVRLSPR